MSSHQDRLLIIDEPGSDEDSGLQNSKSYAEDKDYRFMGLIADPDEEIGELDPEEMEHSAFEFIQSNTSMNGSSHLAPIKVDQLTDMDQELQEGRKNEPHVMTMMEDDLHGMPLHIGSFAEAQNQELQYVPNS